MGIEDAWTDARDAFDFAIARVVGDVDPSNERERADGHRYVLRMLAAITQNSLIDIDPARPEFMAMQEPVRFLGAAGQDIDYDVAIVSPGVAYRISGTRGSASYVGLAVYSHAGDKGASAIVESVDMDTITDVTGMFAYEFSHPQASRVIIRQYFHDRLSQPRGSWRIEPVGMDEAEPSDRELRLPSVAGVEARVRAAAASLRWNAQLNQLWSPELRSNPNTFVRQGAEEIVAAVPNPDVVYSFGWWRLDAGEALVVEVTPPRTRYWGVQLCDRWFQSFPDRRAGLNDRQLVVLPDGRVRIVVSEHDPGVPNWLDTSGHRVGIMFFRWLHTEPDSQPTARVERRIASST